VLFRSKKAALWNEVKDRLNEAGTGLSGGAVPMYGGIQLVLTRMNSILSIDLENRLALVEPGVVNLDLSKYVAHMGLFYAPDPSSQISCTIGGNIAENSGGPHCLKYGVTTNHVFACEIVTEALCSNEVADVTKTRSSTCVTQFDEEVDMSWQPSMDCVPDSGKKPYDSNQAIPTLLFNRSNAILNNLNLSVINKKWLSLFVYPLSGGFQKWSLIPSSFVSFMLRVESKLLPFLGPIMAFRLVVVLKNTKPNC
jgi:hypothetical protein